MLAALGSNEVDAILSGQRVVVLRDPKALAQERRDARADLHQSQERLHLALDAGNMGAWEWDFLTDTGIWNDQCYRLLGYEPGSVTPDYQAWASRVLTEDLPKAEAEVREMIELGAEYAAEYRVLGKDDAVHWVEARGRCQTEAGEKPSRCYGVMLDISQRKLVQERLENLLNEQKAMLENELVGIVKVQDRRILWANPALEQMLGYGPGQLVGAPTRQSFPSYEEYAAFNTNAYPILNKGQVYRAQMELVRKDGRLIWVDISGAVLDVGEGTSLWSFIDISKRMALDLGLKKTSAELEQFAYVATHDLRQPVRMVGSYLGVIEKKLGPQLTDELKTYLGHALGGAKKMDRLISDLLDYSGTGKSARVVSVSLGGCVSDALINLATEIDASGAKISVSDNFPMIAGDPLEFTRLFQSLIGNAIKYRYPGREPEVEIGWSRAASKYRLWVKDNGMGIEEHHYERAFMIFQRLVSRDAYEGSGIGLAISRKIVEQYGGTIWIESQVGVGSTFFMAFPAPAEGMAAAVRSVVP